MILFYLKQMLVPALAAALFYGLAVPVRRHRLHRKSLETTVLHECIFAFFVMFLAGLARLTLTPWASGLKNSVNLIPFTVFRQTAYLLRHGNISYLLINVVGNIVMFWPIGFIPAILWEKPRCWKALFMGFGFSLTIELCQLTIRRGTDVDDLWLNTLGAISGYCIYLLFRSVFPRICTAAKLRTHNTNPMEES